MARFILLLSIFFISFNSYSGEWRLWQSGVQSCKVLVKEECKADILDSVNGASNKSFPYYYDIHTPSSGRWNGDYWLESYLVDYYIYEGDDPQNCSDGSVPEYPAVDCVPETEPHSCPEAGTFYKRLYGGGGINGFSTCIPENCVVAIQREDVQVCIANSDGTESCPWNVFYTGQTCTYDANNPGLQPPDHEWPEDPTEPPIPDTPDITDLPDAGDTDPVYDPDGELLPDDPVTPPNPDPQPDPDNPDLSTGENAIVGELSEANQRLENIDSTLQDLTNTTKLDNDTLHAYQANILGKLDTINTTLTNGVGGGGGGTSQAVVDGLGDIACLLDETCEGGGSQSSVTENQCEAFNCDGDAVICYIARKEWEKRCDVEDFLKEGGTGDQFLEGLNQFIEENPSENVEAGSIDVSNVMNKYTQGNGFEVNSGCPAPRNVDAYIASFNLDYQPFCDLAIVINWFLISISLVGAALMIAKYGF